ncbi:condensation domain-containing protein [Nonomuraea sp. NPDC059023]|uniref:condensation domain-containing protein n=1 Tax=unclassified Nonomuraea TaxID=2593643 RepID=UPI0036C30F14
MTGKLDRSALETALHGVAARHENLRATFDGLRMRPVAELRDFFHVTAAGSREQALSLLERRLQEPFDLAGGPLLRAWLVRVEEDLSLLGLSVDHIIADGKSRDVLVNDLIRLYGAQTAGTDPGLPEVAVQFADYAAWERSYLQGAVLERLSDYWRTTLDGVDPLPASGLTDPAAPGGETGADRVRFTTAPDLQPKLAAAATAAGVSVYGIVSAAVKAAVAAHRLPGSTPHDPYDVAVYGSAANRVLPEVAEVFGYFATPIVFRTDLSGDPTLERLLTMETRAVLGALRRQQLPHSLVTKLVNPAQYGVRHGADPARVPRYVNFDFGSHNDPAAAKPDTGPAGTGRAVFRQVGLPVLPVPRGGLRILSAERPGVISVDVRYRTDFYSRPWVSAFATGIHRFLTAAAGDWSVRLSDVVPARGAGR